MWSCVLLTDPGAESAEFNDLTVVAADNPIAAVDAVERSAATHVLMAAPRALGARFDPTAAIVQGRFPGVRVATLLSEHAPIALFSAMVVARTVTQHPVQGIGLVHRLLDHSWSGAWSRSVAKLAHPTPAVGQHLRSLLPGEGFMIRQHPSPAVLSGVRPADVPGVGVDRILLAQDGGVVPSAIAQRLSELPAVTAVRQVAMPGRWVSVYGTHRVGQVVLAPADPRMLVEPMNHRCPSCLLDQVAPVCPFCRVMTRPDAPVRAGEAV
jgi:hypothetical protein